jgi:hypothetical protein
MICVGLGVGGVKLFRDVSAPDDRSEDVLREGKWDRGGKFIAAWRNDTLFEVRHSTSPDRTEERFPCSAQNQSVLSAHVKNEFKPTHLPDEPVHMARFCG